jgi:hypothetical protein
MINIEYEGKKNWNRAAFWQKKPLKNDEVDEYIYRWLTGLEGYRKNDCITISSSIKIKIMQQSKINFRMLMAVTALLIIGCNEPAATSEKTETDTAAVTTVNEAPAMPSYDPALEPLKVGAQFSKLLSDTLGVKLYEFTVKPGDTVALHNHPDHLVYVLEGGTAAISFNGGAPQIMEMKKGMGFISGALSDHGKNIGKTTIKLVVADIYRPRAK